MLLIYVVAVVASYLQRGRQTRTQVPNSRVLRRRTRGRRGHHVNILVVIGIVQIVLMMATIIVMVRVSSAPSMPSIVVKMVVLPAPTAMPSAAPEAVSGSSLRSGDRGAQCALGHCRRPTVTRR